MTCLGLAQITFYSLCREALGEYHLSISLYKATGFIVGRTNFWTVVAYIGYSLVTFAKAMLIG